MDNKEPENPVVYLSNLVKKLDVKNRNGLVALAIVNLFVILLFKFYLKGSGLLSWLYLLIIYTAFSNCFANLSAFLIVKPPYALLSKGNTIRGLGIIWIIFTPSIYSYPEY